VLSVARWPCLLPSQWECIVDSVRDIRSRASVALEVVLQVDTQMLPHGFGAADLIARACGGYWDEIGNYST